MVKDMGTVGAKGWWDSERVWLRESSLGDDGDAKGRCGQGQGDVGIYSHI